MVAAKIFVRAIPAIINQVANLAILYAEIICTGEKIIGVHTSFFDDEGEMMIVDESIRPGIKLAWAICIRNRSCKRALGVAACSKTTQI